MAWDEWEQLKADAARKHATGMQLDQYPGDQGGGDADLVVHQDDLGAVGHEAFVLHGRLGKQADLAAAGAGKDGQGSTQQAAAALKGHHFAMGPALQETVHVWTTQLKSVLQACAHISNHLDHSRKQHGHDDARIAADLRGRDGSAVSVSRLNDLFE
ncbi:hypothetical protein [Streptomyces sulfonofaciens]|nr:hypothetical protein [Streptomyces sulfonofaciens]